MGAEGGSSIYTDNPAWHAVFAEGHPVLTRYRSVRGLLPSPPRCTMCRAPFRGVGGFLVRRILGIRPNERNRYFCNKCDAFIQATPGGTEVVLSIVYADLEGSTRLSQELEPSTYDRWINERYRRPVVEVLMKHAGFIMDVSGDAVFAVFPPGFVGSEHAELAVEAARELLRLDRGRGEDGVLPFSLAVHTEKVRIGRSELSGALGSATGVFGVKATGRGVNLVAVLADAGAGDEALITGEACAAAGLDVRQLEEREIRLPKLREPVTVRVMTG